MHQLVPSSSYCRTKNILVNSDIKWKAGEHQLTVSKPLDLCHPTQYCYNQLLFSFKCLMWLLNFLTHVLKQCNVIKSFRSKEKRTTDIERQETSRQLHKNADVIMDCSFRPAAKLNKYFGT